MVVITKLHNNHNITNWLSRYRRLSKMLQTYPALLSYFFSIDKQPVLLHHVFENSLGKHYLRHLQSFVAVIYKHDQNIKQSKVHISLKLVLISTL